MAIEIKTKGFVRPIWWWWEPPKFTVNVTLKNREGKPLANQPLGTVSFRSANEHFARTEAARVNEDAGIKKAGLTLSTDNEGKVSLMIEGGRIAVISNLPHGAAFKVEQPTDRMPAGFSQGSAEGATGTITGGRESKVTLSNNYSGAQPNPSDQPGPDPADNPTAKPHPVPKTGDASAPLLWLGMVLLGLLGIGVLTLRKTGKQ